MAARHTARRCAAFVFVVAQMVYVRLACAFPPKFHVACSRKCNATHEPAKQGKSAVFHPFSPSPYTPLRCSTERRGTILFTLTFGRFHIHRLPLVLVLGTPPRERECNWVAFRQIAFTHPVLRQSRWCCRINSFGGVDFFSLASCSAPNAS